MNKIWKNLSLQDLDGEIWKVIDDFPDYQISNLGRIKSLKFKKEKILKQSKCGCYFCIGLWKNGKNKSYKIHTLVFEIYNNYKLKLNEDIHHINGNKEDNNLENLKLMSKSKHHSFHNKGEKHPLFMKHHSEETKKKMSKKKKGISLSENHKKKLSENHDDRRGEKHPNHKLIEQQVIKIKSLLKDGMLTQQKIANIFKIDRRTISAIKNKRVWNHVGE